MYTFRRNKKSSVSCTPSYFHLFFILLIHFAQVFVVVILNTLGNGTSLCGLVQHNKLALHHLIWFFKYYVRKAGKVYLSPIYRKEKCKSQEGYVNYPSL